MSKLLKIIKSIGISIVCACMLVLTGCGSNASEINMLDLRNAMLKSTNALPNMITVSDVDSDAESNFSYLSDFSYGKVDSYFLSYSEDGLADEIAVIRLKDKKDVYECENSLKAHAEGRVKLYEQYDPKETKRAENALILTKDQFVVLIIAEESDKIKEAFNGFF